MYNQVLVGKSHGGTDVEKQRCPLAYGCRVVFDPGSKRNPVDIFHDDIGIAALGGSTVVKPRNVGMRKTGEDLSLAREAFNERLRKGTRSD